MSNICIWRAVGYCV